MAGGNIDNLYIQVSTSAKSASKTLDKLAETLEKVAGITANSGLDKFAEELNDATKEANGLAGALDKIKGVKASVTASFHSTNKLTGAFGSLWKMLKKVAVISGSITLFKKGYGFATDFFETANYFKVVMGEYTEDAYKYAQSVSDALGLDESQWMQNQATFMSLATTFGNTSDSAYLMSKNLTQLVYDLSSLKNVDATAAMQKLRSAFAGEIEPLRDWGVDLSKANLQLVALEHNITKPFDKMTQAEKSQLRYVTIMNQLEYAMGDLTNTLNSPGNQLRVLEMGVQKAARAFGNIFIPILNKVIPVAIAVANALRNLFEKIAAFFGFQYPEMENWDKYTDNTAQISDNLDDATKSAKKFKGQLAGFDEINNLTTNSPSGSGSEPTGSFGNLDLPTYESLGKSFLGDALDRQIENVLKDLPTKFHNFIISVTEKIKAIDWESLGQSFGDSLASIDWKQLMIDVGDFIIAGLTAMLDWLLGASGGLLDTGIAIATGILIGIGNIFRNIVQWIGENIVTPFIDGIKSLFGIHSPSKEMEDIGEDLGDGLLEGLTGLWNKVKQPFIDLWTNIKTGASNAWNSVKEAFSPVTTWFKDKFGKAWDTVKKIFSGEISFKDIKDAVGHAFKEMVNKLIRGLNTVIAKPFEVLNKTLNKIREISILGLQPFIKLWGENPIKVPQIPEIKLAQGGIVTQPTTALIGENGTEAVVPLERNTEWINRVATTINENNTGDEETLSVLNNIYQYLQTMNLQPRVTVDDVGRANEKYLDRKLRIQGV